jgi:hypothetical protein
MEAKPSNLRCVFAATARFKVIDFLKMQPMIMNTSITKRPKIMNDSKDIPVTEEKGIKMNGLPFGDPSSGARRDPFVVNLNYYKALFKWVKCNLIPL